MATTTLSVNGMTCSHCVSAVTKELTALPGVTDVQVELAPEGVSTVTVTSEGPLQGDAVSAAIDEAGYDLAAPVLPQGQPDLIPLTAAEAEPAAGGCGCGGCGCK